MDVSSAYWPFSLMPKDLDRAKSPLTVGIQRRLVERQARIQMLDLMRTAMGRPIDDEGRASARSRPKMRSVRQQKQ